MKRKRPSPIFRIWCLLRAHHAKACSAASVCVCGPSFMHLFGSTHCLQTAIHGGARWRTGHQERKARTREHEGERETPGQPLGLPARVPAPAPLQLSPPEPRPLSKLHHRMATACKRNQLVSFPGSLADCLWRITTVSLALTIFRCSLGDSLPSSAGDCISLFGWRLHFSLLQPVGLL